MIYHFSAIESYLSCGEAFRRRFIENDRLITTRMAVGTALSKAAEEDSRAKVEGPRVLTLSETVDLGLTKYDELRASTPFADPQNFVLGEQQTRDSCRTFARDVSPNILEVLFYEHRWGMEIEVPARDGTIEVVHFEGTPDVVTAPGIGDYKTGRRWGADEAVRNRQLQFYSLLHLANLGRWPESLWIDNIFRHGKVFGHQRLYVPTGLEHTNACVQMLAAVKRGIDSQTFLPAAGFGWRCSPKYCSFYETCKYTGGTDAKPSGSQPTNPPACEGAPTD